MSDTRPTDAPGDSPSPGDEEFGGVTLLDLFLMISGAWAVPLAVISNSGERNLWRIPAFLAGGVVGLFWGWYCKVLEHFNHRWLLSRKSVPTGRPSLAVIVAVYFGVLALSLLAQYALYRLLRAALGAAVGHGVPAA